MESRKIPIHTSTKGAHIARLDFSSGQPTCDYKVGGRKSFGRRERPDGTTYSFPIITGERCTRTAVTSIKKDGKLLRRCARHASATY